MPPDRRNRKGHTPDRHFRIPQQEHAPAKAKAAREGRTMTWIVRHALRLYVHDKLPMDTADGENPPPGETGSGQETDL